MNATARATVPTKAKQRPQRPFRPAQPPQIDPAIAEAQLHELRELAGAFSFTGLNTKLHHETSPNAVSHAIFIRLQPDRLEWSLGLMQEILGCHHWKAVGLPTASQQAWHHVVHAKHPSGARVALILAVHPTTRER